MNNALQIIDKAPVELVTREQVEATIAKIRVMVPDAPKMNLDQLKHIAQESILFRTLPGKDVHYFINPKTGKLERVEDYKFLISFTENKERIITGDSSLRIKHKTVVLSTQEKITEGVGQDDYAVRVTVTTSHDADAFRKETKAWMDLGLNVKDAMIAAREALGGEVGVTSVGVVRKDDGNVPRGWTPLQKAEKLAIKNAIHKRWGAPTVDELAAYVRGMAKLAQPDDWNDVPVDLPAEAQARYADLVAVAKDVAESSSTLTIEQHQDRLTQNTALLRGECDSEIGGTQIQPAPTNGKAKKERPLTPADLYDGLHRRADGDDGQPSTKAHQGLVASKLEECFAPDKDAKGKRLTVLHFLWGIESAKDLTFKQAKVTLDWLLSGETDSGGDHRLHPAASTEAQQVYYEALKAAGQTELPAVEPDNQLDMFGVSELDQYFPRGKGAAYED